MQNCILCGDKESSVKIFLPVKLYYKEGCLPHVSAEHERLAGRNKMSLLFYFTRDPFCTAVFIFVYFIKFYKDGFGFLALFLLPCFISPF